MTLYVNTNNYESVENVTKSLTIKPATPTLNLPSHTGKYEDRVGDENLIANANATNSAGVTVDGTFSYNKTDVVYPTDSTSRTETISVKVTFEPTDKDNYSSSESLMLIELLPVAKNDSGNYFGKVEDALKNTSSGVISLLVGTNPIIYKNVTPD